MEYKQEKKPNCVFKFIVIGDSCILSYSLIGYSGWKIVLVVEIHSEQVLDDA